MKLQLFKENQIYRQMTIYGQIRGILNARTMNVLAQEQGQRGCLYTEPGLEPGLRAMPGLENFSLSRHFHILQVPWSQPFPE